MHDWNSYSGKRWRRSFLGCVREMVCWNKWRTSEELCYPSDAYTPSCCSSPPWGSKCQVGGEWGRSQRECRRQVWQDTKARAELRAWDSSDIRDVFEIRWDVWSTPVSLDPTGIQLHSRLSSLIWRASGTRKFLDSGCQSSANSNDDICSMLFGTAMFF